jgi:ribA/ribD-fused uncharacterized protein
MIKEFQGNYRFLSNFWWFDGITVEHLYQVKKCLHFEDAEKILKATTPGDAKRMGRHVEIKPNWEEIKIKIMLQLLEQKFSNPEMKRKLLATGKEYLQEGNRWGDTYWGVDLKTGKGENHLGQLIMIVRDKINKG